MSTAIPPTEPESLVPLLDELQLDAEALREVRDAFREQIQRGLAEDGQPIRALPAYLHPPSTLAAGGEDPNRSPARSALVVDAGGTNVRAAVIEVTAKGGAVRKGPQGARLSVREGETDAAGFFGQQAALAAALEPAPGLAVGYCFSYPSRSLPSGDAELLAWTKGLDIEGVVGTAVGTGLVRALDGAGVTTSGLVVLNDTVAALLAGTLTAAAPSRTIGLIVGTGTNMAAFFAPVAGRKLEGNRPMAVNLESGNLTPPGLTALDHALDKASLDPGRQRFEKAVSGHWLPHLLALAFPELGLDPAEGAGVLAELAAEDSAPGRVAAALLARSADLVAAGLAGVAPLLEGAGPVTVLAEGGLFWNAPGYPDRVRRSFALLCDEELVIVQVANANLIGSAVAVLSREHDPVEDRPGAPPA